MKRIGFTFGSLESLVGPATIVAMSAGCFQTPRSMPETGGSGGGTGIAGSKAGNGGPAGVGGRATGGGGSAGPFETGGGGVAKGGSGGSSTGIGGTAGQSVGGAGGGAADSAGTTGGTAGAGGNMGAAGGSAATSGAGGTAVCTNTTTDAANCGRCGHSCLGGTCEAGVCQPVTLASGRGRLFVVAVDASYVYFGGDGIAIGRVPKATGTVVPLTSTFYAYDWTTAGSRLFWVNDWEQRDMQTCVLPDCGTGPTAVGAGTLNYYALVSDPAGANLYYSGVDSTAPASQQSAIWGRAVVDGVTRRLLTGIASHGLAADGTNVYFSNTDGKLIEKMSPTGTSRATLAVSPTSPTFITVCGTRLYWVDGMSVYTTPLPNGTGTSPVPAFGTSGQNVRGIICDDAGVYWINHAASSGTVVSCPHSGCDGAPNVLALGQDLPWGIAVDANAVYWVTESGSVFKVAK